MSVEDIKRLDADIKKDEALATEFKGCKDVDAFVALATTKGYKVSADDLKAASSKDLSDEELDSVAGGQFIIIAGVSAGAILIKN